jgi:predicted O-linked N-acetylglucosamine transferase (SPINDLY family)
MVIDSPATPVAPAVAGTPSALVAPFRAAVAAFAENPDNVSAWGTLIQLRQQAAAAIARLPGGQRSGVEVDAARELLKIYAESGAGDLPATAKDLAQATELQVKSWPGLLAAMLMVPSWQWPDAPALESVPSWLWADYTRYLFHTPQGFAAVGQAEAYAAHILRRLEQLSRLAGANRGSSAVRAALGAYVAVGNSIPLYFANESLRKHFELRGRILAAAVGVGRQEALEPRLRYGRRLRVGFVNRHFGPQTETYTTLPLFEQLDAERFEVFLFVNQASGTPVEEYARGRVAEFHVLPAGTPAQVEALRAAELDVVVFGTNVTAVCNETTLLALHRVAPLQVVNNSSCTTTGFPEIDLYVSGTATESPEAPAHFTERLGLVPGPAHAFNYEADRAEPTTAWTRETLGLGADEIVFVSAANYFKITPEMQQVWARLLASVPGSKLLVHPFNPNWSSEYPIRRFQLAMEQALAEQGVSSERLLISSARFPSRSDVKALLGVGNIYLDTFPFGGVNSLVDPLELAMPVVAWEGGTFRSRMGAALLRSLGLPDLIASDEAGYLALAGGLVRDAVRRQACVESIRARMERVPVFLDPLAASDAFGDLIETAYDELSLGGREAFRANREPLRASGAENPNPANEIEARDVLRVDPSHSRARHVLGIALRAAGRTDRAVAYLLAAVQGEERNAALWLDLALALRANNQVMEAIQALEAGLRLDDTLLEGWVMLAELAQAVGATDLAREAGGVAHKLAPSDPRTLQLAS